MYFVRNAKRLDTTRESIVNGTPTKAFPAVGYLAVPGGVRFCSATLVAPKVALTAAHCVFDMAAGSFEFRAAPEEQDSYVGYLVDGVILHPKYVENDLSDIAILMLRDAPAVAPLPLDLSTPSMSLKRQAPNEIEGLLCPSLIAMESQPSTQRQK